MAEEIAARAAALKDMSTGSRERNRQQNYKNSLNYAYGKPDEPRDEQRERLASPLVTGLLAFPDILAPGTRQDVTEQSHMSEMLENSPQHYDRAAYAPHRSMYSSSSFSVRTSFFYAYANR